jgi:hypothetical protein
MLRLARIEAILKRLEHADKMCLRHTCCLASKAVHPLTEGEGLSDLVCKVAQSEAEA